MIFLLLACDLVSSSSPVPLSRSIPPAGHRLTFVNRCTEPIWVGTTGNTGFPALENGGWAMEAGSPTAPAHHVAWAPLGWQGRVWPRTGCAFNAEDGPRGPKNSCPTASDGSPGPMCCATGSCLQRDNATFGLACAYPGVPPVSLVEPSFDAPGGFGPYDDVDISFVDGWSVPVSIAPDAGTFNPTPDPGLQAPWCTLDGCTATPVCPAAYAVPGSPSSCFSPCQVATQTQDPDRAKLCCVCSTTDGACDCASSQVPGGPEAGCCDGEYGCTPNHAPAYPADLVCNPWDTATPERAWNPTAQGYIAAVHVACPGVYAWQFDDVLASYQCRKTDGEVDYTITFCP